MKGLCAVYVATQKPKKEMRTDRTGEEGGAGEKHMFLNILVMRTMHRHCASLLLHHLISHPLFPFLF